MQFFFHTRGKMGSIRVAGTDPSLANFGLAKMMLDLDTLDLSIVGIRTIKTEPRKNKKLVRQNSDDLRRARELQEGFCDWVKDCTLCFTEVPSGTQHARSALAFGVAIGVLAGSPVQLIEIMPEETKLASVGIKTAGKPEIIRWAAGLYPDLPWQRYEKESSRGKTPRKAGDLHDDNEHAADACAVIHAGIRTVQFRQLLSLWRGASANIG